MTNQPTNGNIIKIIIQAGGIGLALVAMWMYFETVNNHISHNADVLSKFEASISIQTEVLKDLKTLIQTRIK